MSFNITFEILPDELILEICRYLYPSDILLSFCGLNYRLNRTISDFIYHIHLSSIISYKNYLYLLKIILPSIWSSIESLTISNCQILCLTKIFLETIENILPINLKELNLFHINLNDIYYFINRLMNKCLVEKLIIDCTDTDYSKQQVFYNYKIAQILFFHHPTLKSIELRGDILFDLSHLSFLSLSNNDDSNVIDLTNMNRSFILQRLTVPLRSLSSLHLLLIYQPYLEYLNVHIGNAKTTYGYTITPFPPLINLREFHFHSDDLAIKFENISELLTYFPNLKSLSLDLTTECRVFFDGDILQTLVYSLESFQFSIARFSAPTFEEQTLSTFHTSFWLETKKWFIQAYWHIDIDNIDSSYFHIYSIPFPFSNFDIYKCTNENLLSNEQVLLYPNVKRIDLSDTSDINVIPFLKRCPYVQTICLNDIYDDEENYGTDDEEDEDDIDQFDENIPSIDSSQSLLPKLFHVRHIILVALPGNDLAFFERLVCVTPNLNRLRIYNDDLIEIIRYPQQNLCQILGKQISQLEIHRDHNWLSLDIRRDIPKILHIFSNIKSLKISFYSSQKTLFKILKEYFKQIFKFQTNLLCITIDDTSPIGFESLLRQNGIELIQTWLPSSWKTLSHIELNSSSISIWL